MALRDILVHFGVDVDQTSLYQMQTNVNKLVIRLNQLQRIAGFAMAAFGVGELTEAADKVINFENRLKAVTNSLEEFETAEKGVIDVSRATFTTIEDVAQLFQRYTQVTTKLGLSQEEVIDFTHRLTQATKLSGAGAAETRGALIQLAQGIGTNFRASGQEIRSIQEQAPELAKIIAKAAGGGTDDLLLMAKQGKITSRLVVDALRDAGPELDRMWAKRTKSFEDISNRFRTEWHLLVKQMLPAISRIIDKLGDLVQWTQEWVEDGSGLNTVISLLIVSVGFLAMAFGGLAFQMLLAASPFIGMFLLVEDLVTMFRGGESVIGDFIDAFFGAGAAAATVEWVTETVGSLIDSLGVLLSAGSMTSDEFSAAFLRASQAIGEAFDAMFAGLGRAAKDVGEFFVLLGEQIWNSLTSAVMRVLAWLPNQMTKLGDMLADGVRSVIGEKAADFLGIESSGRREINRGYAARDEREAEAYNNAMHTAVMSNPEITPEQRVQENWMNAGWAERIASTFTSPALPGLTGKDPMLKYGDTQITNQITVTGNATPAVAREIAERTGAATEQAVGRDRSAVGAAFGVP